MLALMVLLAAAHNANAPAEVARSAIVTKCGIPAERLATIDPTPELPTPGIEITGSASLSDKQLRCYGDQMTADIYPMFEDDHIGDRYSRLIEIEARRNARIAMRHRGLLARLPRFDRRHESLRHFARRLEALCHAKLGSVLHVRNGHIEVVDTALAPDGPTNDAEICSIDAATASGHNPLYVVTLPVIPVDLPISGTTAG